MNIKLAFFLGITCITLSSCSYNKFAACDSETGGDNNYCSTCQCTDLGYGRNDCISNSEYCDAFGNVGAR